MFHLWKSEWSLTNNARIILHGTGIAFSFHHYEYSSPVNRQSSESPELIKITADAMRVEGKRLNMLDVRRVIHTLKKLPRARVVVGSNLK